MGETFAGLASSGLIDTPLAGGLRRAIGFRNITVHNYQTIDRYIVFVLSGMPQVDLEDFVAQVTSGL